LLPSVVPAKPENMPTEATQAGVTAIAPSGNIDQFAGAPSRQNLTYAFVHSIGLRALMVLANSATGIMTARSLHPDGRGELSAILLGPQVLAGIAALGVPTALTYHIRLHAAGKDDYVAASTYLALVCSAAAMIVGLVSIPYALSHYSASDVLWAKWLMISVMVAILLSVARGTLEGEGRFFFSNILLVAPHLLTVVGISVLVLTKRMSILPAGLVYVLTPVIPLLAACLSARAYRWRSPWSLVGPAKQLLSYGLRSYGGDLSGILTLYIDQALVVALLSPIEMGAYVIALNLSRTVNIAQQSICAILFPQSVGRSTEATILLNRRALQASIALSLIAGGVVSILGSALLRILYGKAYMISAGVLRILLLEVLLNGVVAVCAQAFMALNRPGIVTLQQICGLVLAVPLLAWLIPRYGLVGAGFGILGATTFRTIVILASFPVFLGRPAPGLLPNAGDRAWFLDRLGHLWRSRPLEAKA